MTTNSPNFEILNDFKIDENHIGGQYNKLYIKRLDVLRPRLAKRVKDVWNRDLVEMSDLKDGQESVICGILYKHMNLQHTALKEIEKNLKLESIEYLKNYTSVDDVVFIDDEYQRLELRNFKHINEIVSGVVVALRGVYFPDGSFSADDILYPGLPPLIHINEITDNNKYILFLSGIQIDQVTESNISLQFLIDILSGIIEPEPDFQVLKNISHVIFAGNLFSEDSINSLTYTYRNVTVKSENNIISNSQNLDNLIFQLSLLIPVIIMPGSNDPCTAFLPQQPIHESFFPQSIATSNCYLATNPLRCLIDGYEILGTSGENIKAICEYSSMEDSLSITEYCLTSNIIFPNSPENISCFKFINIEPFIINHTPRVFFCGSCSQFTSKIVQDANAKSLILCLPKFCETLTAVAVNLNTLESVLFKL